MCNPDAAEATAAELNIINDFFLTLSKPKSFEHRHDNFIIQQEQAFEDLVCVLEDNGATNTKQMTVFEFMKRTDYLERKFKPASV